MKSGTLFGKWRRARAQRCARLLDEMVDSQVALLPHLPEPARRDTAERLARLVMLSQSYVHYGRGWISRRELHERGCWTLLRPDAPREHPDGATHRA